MEHPMMKCGHAANSIGSRGDLRYVPACAICDCFEVDATPPSLEGRTARCFYYGNPALKLRDMGGCDTRADHQSPCFCEKPSDLHLWFFEMRPDKDHDTFYCGCHGYD